MSTIYKKAISTKDVQDFCEETVKRISRIESVHSVVGTLFLRNGSVQMYTVPESMAQTLVKKLPSLNSAMHRALTEIDIQNELVAYRILCRGLEVVVAGGEEFAAVLVHKVKKKKRTGTKL